MVDVAPPVARTRSFPASIPYYEEPRDLSRRSSGRYVSTQGRNVDRDEAVREIEELRRKGLYRGVGSERAERVDMDRAEQYVVETAPITEERIRTRQVHEVVPTVRREREVAEVRHAVLPIKERVREGATYSERTMGEFEEQELRSQMADEERRKNQRISEQFSRSVIDERPVVHEYRYGRPVVEERVHPRIIHEVHPIIQREIEREHYDRKVLPIHEHIVEGARVADEIEVLRPLTRDEWERAHGSSIYREASWRYGRDADEFMRRENLMEDLRLSDRRRDVREGPAALERRERHWDDEEFEQPRIYRSPRRTSTKELRRVESDEYEERPRYYRTRSQPMIFTRGGRPAIFRDKNDGRLYEIVPRERYYRPSSPYRYERYGRADQQYERGGGGGRTERFYRGPSEYTYYSTREREREGERMPSRRVYRRNSSASTSTSTSGSA